MFTRQHRRKVRNWAIGVLGPPVVRAWAATLRVRIAAELEMAGGRLRIPDGIVLVWHQRLFTLASSFPGSGFRALVSEHADGEMLARVLEGLGLEPIRGSTTRGGVRAVRELLRTGEGPVRVAITPDGPRGPALALQPGAIYLASKTGLPIYTVAVGAARGWFLPTWDRFFLPRPFTRALLSVAGPYVVPPDLDRSALERRRREVEAAFRRQSEEVDGRFEELYAQGIRFRGFLKG